MGGFLIDQDTRAFGSNPSARRCSAQSIGSFSINRLTVSAFGLPMMEGHGDLRAISVASVSLW